MFGRIYLHEVPLVLVIRIGVVDDVAIPCEVLIVAHFPNGVFAFVVVVHGIVVVCVVGALRYAGFLGDRVFHLIATEILPEEDGPVGAACGVDG